MDKNRAIILGILGALVVVGGVAMSVVIFFMLDVLQEGYIENSSQGDENFKKFKDNSQSPMWALGFAFIIPGVFLFVAALIQNKAGYIISAILSLLTLLLMGIFVLAASLFLFIFIVSIGAIDDHCKDTSDGCICHVEDDNHSSSSEDVILFRECHYFSSFASLMVALFICIIVSWILLLIAFILAIYFSCRSNTNQAGNVYAPVQQPVFTSSQYQSPPPSYAYEDQGKLTYLEGGSQSYYDGPPSKV
ncbi:hypothetical protein EGW08_017568 [Elysia chlorotica]|uniref:MARVEL domain-containing protein n=1 Tax=Elysia chlorotica TaxID=188477 RepID=A0A3S0ZAS4_ELYCH|nr:hypothetical protein EGW08_017568 [Elysia chlorotica]